MWWRMLAAVDSNFVNESDGWQQDADLKLVVLATMQSTSHSHMLLFGFLCM